MKNFIPFIFEAAVVKRLKRTGWQILGDNEEDVGGHTFMTAVIAYVLAKQTGANLEKVLLMSLFHDFHEARTGEVDKLAKLYVTRNTEKANRDIFGDIDPNLLEILHEYEKRETLAAQIAYEANVLALCVELKQLVERGNVNAKEWLDANSKRVTLPRAIVMAHDIMSTNSQIWWKRERDLIHREFHQI